MESGVYAFAPNLDSPMGADGSCISFGGQVVYPMHSEGVSRGDKMAHIHVGYSRRETTITPREFGWVVLKFRSLVTNIPSIFLKEIVLTPVRCPWWAKILD